MSTNFTTSVHRDHLPRLAAESLNASIPIPPRLRQVCIPYVCLYNCPSHPSCQFPTRGHWRILIGPLQHLQKPVTKFQQLKPKLHKRRRRLTHTSCLPKTLSKSLIQVCSLPEYSHVDVDLPHESLQAYHNTPPYQWKTSLTILQRM